MRVSPQRSCESEARRQDQGRQHASPGVQVSQEKHTAHCECGVQQTLLDFTPPDGRQPSLIEPSCFTTISYHKSSASLPVVNAFWVYGHGFESFWVLSRIFLLLTWQMLSFEVFRTISFYFGYPKNHEIEYQKGLIGCSMTFWLDQNPVVTEWSSYKYIKHLNLLVHFKYNSQKTGGKFSYCGSISWSVKNMMRTQRPTTIDVKHNSNVIMCGMQQMRRHLQIYRQ